MTEGLNYNHASTINASDDLKYRERIRRPKTTLSYCEREQFGYTGWEN